mgnify:CR=1 FL=1
MSKLLALPDATEGAANVLRDTQAFLDEHEGKAQLIVIGRAPRAGKGAGLQLIHNNEDSATMLLGMISWAESRLRKLYFNTEG